MLVSMQCGEEFDKMEFFLWSKDWKTITTWIISVPKNEFYL